ncbi:hypothetical protein EYC80_005659 [Monilinia laxa]|uniref:Uncharacterized protein n=1 Tax=Monilinia laxa TaxID=61186 RepID=A0A5N6KEQ7_MONLA|nr:hypothetical protein EYC80_005659 [Monilinia laxa]
MSLPSGGNLTLIDRGPRQAVSEALPIIRITVNDLVNPFNTPIYQAVATTTRPTVPGALPIVRITVDDLVNSVDTPIYQAAATTTQHTIPEAFPIVRITVDDLVNPVDTPIYQAAATTTRPTIPEAFPTVRITVDDLVNPVDTPIYQAAAITTWPFQPKPPQGDSSIIAVWPATSNLNPRKHLIQGQVVLPHTGRGSQAWISARSRAKNDSIAKHIVCILHHCGEVHLRSLVEALSKFWLEKYKEFASAILGGTVYIQLWDVLEKSCRQTLSKASYAELFERVPKSHGTWRLSTSQLDDPVKGHSNDSAMELNITVE